MKKNLLLIVFLGCVISGYSQTEIAKDSLYIVTYTTGDAWDKSKGPGEQPYFKEHSGHLSKLRKEGVIKFGARYADKGIIVITAAGMNAAKDIIFSDHAIANKLFQADIQKLSVFYDGCVTK
jgi:hypothetical protein